MSFFERQRQIEFADVERYYCARSVQSFVTLPVFWCIEAVALWPGRGLVSNDNRRLWCFKEHQKHVRQQGGGDVFCLAYVFQLPANK